MIGKPEWFKIRKYGGWGIVPDSWQGWIYLAVIMIPFVVFQSLPYWSMETRTAVTTAWMVILLVDVTDIMIRLKKDEREVIEEAIAERNASWAMIYVLVGILLYDMFSGLLRGEAPVVNKTAMMALAAGAIVKSATNWWFDKRRK